MHASYHLLSVSHRTRLRVARRVCIVFAYFTGCAPALLGTSTPTGVNGGCISLPDKELPTRSEKGPKSSGFWVKGWYDDILAGERWSEADVVRTQPGICAFALVPFLVGATLHRAAFNTVEAAVELPCGDLKCTNVPALSQSPVNAMPAVPHWSALAIMTTPSPTLLRSEIYDRWRDDENLAVTSKSAVPVGLLPCTTRCTEQVRRRA